MKFTRLAALVITSAVGCTPQPAVPVARQHAQAPATSPATSSTQSKQQTAPTDVKALFGRELDHLPPLVPAAGQGWTTEVAGTNVSNSPGTVDQSERFSFAFEESARTECTVFDSPIDAAAYFGKVLAEIKKSLIVVGVYPTGIEVEREIPIYFASIRYHKQTDAGVLAGQLKLALGMHRSRPVVCLHDVPGYTETFRNVARSLFAHYRVANDEVPAAISINVARVGDLPVGFTHESRRDLPGGRSVTMSISSEIVPRSETEIMVSDEAERLEVENSRIIEGRFVQADLRGTRLDLTLTSSGRNHYRVAGTFGNKPLEAKFEIKGGLPSSEATSQRLQRELAKNRAFRFTQREYHASLDPTSAVEVQYFRLDGDPARTVHVAIGQVEVLATLDEHGDQVRSEMNVGPQTLVVERVYQRDARREHANTSHR